MAKEFSKKFYKSKRWQKTRRAYINNMPIEKKGLCEWCYYNGIYKPCSDLHHIIELTPYNINDSNIAISFDNLIMLCKECHNKIHLHKDDKPYFFDKHGNLKKNEEIPPIFEIKNGLRETGEEGFRKTPHDI